jgi:uncharacterized protein YodC (DUF2158 family)
MLQTPKYFVGDVVLVSNTAMTVSAIRFGLLHCVWFDKEHHLHRRAFGPDRVRPFNFTINVPSSVIVGIKKWNST